MAAFSGFYESHKPPPSGNACGIIPATAMAIEMVSKVDTFCIFVLFAVALAVPGQYGASSRPMAASIGFR